MGLLYEVLVYWEYLEDDDDEEEDTKKKHF